MGNFIKETAAKVAGNVTQSVTSAVLVTLITTYVLVDIGKKDSGKPDVKSDSLKIVPMQQPAAQPDDRTGLNVERKTNQDRSTFENKPFLTNGKRQTGERTSPGNEVTGDQREGEVKTVIAKKADNPRNEMSLAASKVKSDSVAKEKQGAKDVQHVKKRAEDVFDELDDEVAKKPPF